MRTDEGRRGFSFLTTTAWLVTKGLKSKRFHIAKIFLITALAVIELSIFFWLTRGIITFMVVSITLVLFVLAISEVTVNAMLERTHRVRILMAFGAKRGVIALWLLTESVIGSMLGSLFGSMMGLIVINSLSLPVANLPLHSYSVFLPFSLGAFTGVMASIYPILKTMKTSISERY